MPSNNANAQKKIKQQKAKAAREAEGGREKKNDPEAMAKAKTQRRTQAEKLAKRAKEQKAKAAAMNKSGYFESQLASMGMVIVGKKRTKFGKKISRVMPL